MKGVKLFGKQKATCDLCLLEYEKGTGIHGAPWKIEGTICQECVDWLGGVEQPAPSASHAWPDDEELWWAGQAQKVDVTGPAAHTPNNVNVTYAPLCKHHLVPFEVVHGVTVHLTASRDRGETMQGPLPTSAVYLAETWLNDLVLTNDGSDMRVEGEPRTLYLDWPDYGRVEIGPLMQAITWAQARLAEGATLEIGCMGGHGRTGTFAAALAVAYGSDSHEAIKGVRQMYCHRAIENVKQENLVHELRFALRPDDGPIVVVPAPPLPKPYVAPTATQVAKAHISSNGGASENSST